MDIIRRVSENLNFELAGQPMRNRLGLWLLRHLNLITYCFHRNIHTLIYIYKRAFGHPSEERRKQNSRQCDRHGDRKTIDLMASDAKKERKK